MLQAHAYFIGHFMYVLSDNHVTIGKGTMLKTIKNRSKKITIKNTFWYYRISILAQTIIQ